MFGKDIKKKGLEDELAEIVKDHPEQIMTSSRHKPGKEYVKIGGKRIYFAYGSGPKITDIYHRERWYERAIRKAKKSFKANWPALKTSQLVLLLTALMPLYFLFEPEEWKESRFEKVCSLLTGSKATYADGKVKLASKREAIDGKVENVNITVDPASWLFSRGGGNVTKYVPETYTTITEPFKYDGGDAWLYRENKRWIHGSKKGNTIEWESPQGTGERKGKISGHVIEKKGELIKDY